MKTAQRRELDRATLADVAIEAAIAEVDKLPLDERLFAARRLLERAQLRIADFLDGRTRETVA